MARRVGFWIPDTCSGRGDSERCHLEYQYDDSVDPSDRTHTLLRVVQRCQAHSLLASDAVVFTSAFSDNTVKNDAIGLIKLTAPRGVETVVNSDGAEVRIFQAGFGLTWSFDASRVLHMQLRGYDASERTIFQALMNSTFGAGRVVIG